MPPERYLEQGVKLGEKGFQGRQKAKKPEGTFPSGFHPLYIDIYTIQG
jgi:hypothetical protein